MDVIGDAVQQEPSETPSSKKDFTANGDSLQELNAQTGAYVRKAEASGAELMLPLKVKVTKGKNAQEPVKPEGKRDSYYRVFDSVPFTPSQGVLAPSPHAMGWQVYSPFAPPAPYPESPNTVLARAHGQSDGSTSSDSSNQMLSPVHPSHMGQPVAFMMYHPVGFHHPEPQSPHPPPSPLMGSPVSTPTAMMFPQTPFAGAHHTPVGFHGGPYPMPPAHANPFAPEAMSPRAGPGGYFHPLFNSFPQFMPAAPPQSMPTSQPANHVASHSPPPPAPPPPAPAGVTRTSSGISFGGGSNASSPRRARGAANVLGSEPAAPALSAAGRAAAAATAAHGAGASSTAPSDQAAGGSNAGSASNSFSFKRPPALQIQNPPTMAPVHATLPQTLPFPWAAMAPMHALAPYQLVAAAVAAGLAPTQPFTPPPYQHQQPCMPMSAPPHHHVLPQLEIPFEFPELIPLPHVYDGLRAACNPFGVPAATVAQIQAQMQTMTVGRPPRPFKPRRNAQAQELKFGPDGLPRLNARQRRTLRRAKERALKGLWEAGHVSHQKAAAAGEGSNSGADSDDNSEVDPGSKAANASAEETTMLLESALSVAGGSHGHQAAEAATEVLHKVAADLEDMDINDLISQLSQRKDEGLVDEKLIRDLQIIQNLLGVLKIPGSQGESSKPQPSAAAAIGISKRSPVGSAALAAASMPNGGVANGAASSPSMGPSTLAMAMASSSASSPARMAVSSPVRVAVAGSPVQASSSAPRRVPDNGFVQPKLNVMVH